MDPVCAPSNNVTCELIKKALSLDGIGMADQKRILVELFSPEELGDKRRYKRLAMHLHPDKNHEREKDATQALQLFLSAMDAQMEAHHAAPIMDKIEAERVKLGLNLVGQEVRLKNVGAWSTVPMKLVDFSEETLRFKTCPPSGQLWTGLLGIHPQDACANSVVKLSSDGAVDDLAQLKPKQGCGHRLSRALIRRLAWKPTKSHLPVDFRNFGPHTELKAPNEMQALADMFGNQSCYWMFDPAFDNGLTGSGVAVDVEIQEVAPESLGNQTLRIALVQLVNPFGADESLALGNFDHALVEAFVIRQRLGPERVLALETEAKERIFQLADVKKSQQGVREGGQNIGADEGGQRCTDQTSLALKIADEVTNLIVEEDKKTFGQAMGAGFLHQQETEAKSKIRWFEFADTNQIIPQLQRLIGRGGMIRCGIDTRERAKYICVHPRNGKHLAETDQYKISLHAALAQNVLSAEQEIISSKRLDDLVLTGVLRECEIQQKDRILKRNVMAICDTAHAAAAA